MKEKVRISGRSNFKLQVIKFVKEYSGLGLKESKLGCDLFFNNSKEYFEFGMEPRLIQEARINFEDVGIKFSYQDREKKIKRILYSDQSIMVKDMLLDISKWETIGIITNEEKETLTYNQCREKAVEKIYAKYEEYIKEIESKDEFSKVFKEIKEINKKEVKSLPIKFIKFNEEFGEMCAEYLKLEGATYKPYDKEELKAEMADALQVLLSIYSQIEDEAGITIDDVLETIKIKNVKWVTKIDDYTKMIF